MDEAKPSPNVQPVATASAMLPKDKRSGWQKLREQLLRPKQLSRKEILRRQRLREKKLAARRQLLRAALLKAGIESKPEVVSNWLFKICVLVNVLVAIYLVIKLSSFFKYGVFYVTFLIITAWIAVFLFILFLLWLSLYIVLDLLIYRRKVGIEEVLPDFLLLASANIRAGMPIDRALWYAVRPRFGVLTKEIEIVAKETMSGEDLETALKKFAHKYDSPVLKNTISLLIESINAGGEIGNLLSKISTNIQDNKLLQKEMAAGISAYAIFIAVAALVMAPLLFALSSQLLVVISKITSSLNLPPVSLPIFTLGKGGVGVKEADFLKFVFVNLFLTSLFSAMLVTIIRKGEIKAGVKYIPVFIATSLLVFLASYKLFGGVFGSLF